MAAAGRALFVLCVFACLSCNLSERRHAKYVRRPPTTVGQPWPMPQAYRPTQDTLYLDSDVFRFHSTLHCDVLENAFKRYFQMIFNPDRISNVLYFKSAPRTKGSKMLEGLTVTIKSCDKYPSLDMDEHYTLETSGTLTATTVWGALRGLETFSQVVYELGSGQMVVNVTSIGDFPRFSHRGVLLDTSRHFIHKDIIMQNIEAMAQSKLNVFHWHIVDDPSFPYESKAFPEMSQKGAYDPYTHVYTQADIAEVIEFARLRGVRVVPEFDTPGHTQSWGLGIKDLLTKCYSAGKFDGSYGPIDPSLNSSYSFLKSFIQELVSVFPDKYLHLGGDEVSFNCWQSNPAIAAFMQKSGFGKDYSKLEEYFEQQLLNIIKSVSSSTGYIIWQEVIDNGVTVKPDTVVQVWKGGYQAELAKVTKLGYTTLLSSCWYLDDISYGRDWETYYKCDPQNFDGSAIQKKLVVGGEACLWGEFVDGTNVISRLWPRALSIAERLWSAQNLTSINDAMPRFEEMRCRMIRRGIYGEPQNGPSFCKYEARPQLPAYMYP